MKLQYCVAIALTGLSLSAQAQNAAWSGCYAGLNAGYGNGYNQITQLYGIPQDAGSAHSNGMLGGAQLGCDSRHGNLVIGLQGLVDIADISGEHVYIDGTGPGDHVSYKTDKLATLTGRAGYLLNDAVLVYAKAGWAWAANKYQDSDPSGVFLPPYIDRADVTRNGWIAGLGVEYAFAKKFSVFAEYSHIQFGKKDISLLEVSGPDAGTLYQYRIDQNVDTALIGVNYHF